MVLSGRNGVYMLKACPHLQPSRERVRAVASEINIVVTMSIRKVSKEFAERLSIRQRGGANALVASQKLVEIGDWRDPVL